MSDSLPIIATVLALFAVVVALAEVARRTAIPYPTLMVIAGLIIAFVQGLPKLTLSPDLVFLVFLPPILYAGAWNTSLNNFKRYIRPISILAIGLVLATTGVVAIVAHAVIPDLSWPAAFVLGAIVSPPDAAAATAICERLRVPQQIVTIIEGESLVNDATGLIAYRVALGVLLTGNFSAWGAAGNMVIAGVGGIAIGLIGGWIIAKVHERFRDPIAATAISLLACYAVYLPADLVHTSGVLAVVTAGFVVSRKSPRVFTPQARLEALAVWQVLILLLNGLLFVLIGLALQGIGDIKGRSFGEVALYAAAISAAVIILRLLWVFPGAYIPRWFSRRIREREAPPSLRGVAIVGWTGMRGVVSLAAALALPSLAKDGSPLPDRDLIVVLVFGVILATLVLQSATLPGLIRIMRLDLGEDEEFQASSARIASALAALERIEQVTRDSTVPPEVAESLRSEYRDRLTLEATCDAERRHQGHETSLQANLELRAAALAAERDAIITLRDRGEIDDGVFRRLERRLDLAQTELAEEHNPGADD